MASRTRRHLGRHRQLRRLRAGQQRVQHARCSPPCTVPVVPRSAQV